MADKVGDVFDGYITGVAPFGLFVELVEHYVEGLVHVSTMADDYYRFREQSHALFGENTKKTYRLGDQRARAGRPRRHGAAPDRPRPRRRAREGPRATSGRRGPARSSARPKKEQRKGTPEAAAQAQSSGSARSERKSDRRAVTIQESIARCAHRRRHRRPHRPRQEHAGQALTGIDPDRLKEEKARGITIELGLRAHHRRRHARRVRRRARPRAVRADDAGRRRRHRLRAADRRGRRIGDAADARALRHLPAAAHSARHRRR